jgi:hypothetical protein
MVPTPVRNVETLLRHEAGLKNIPAMFVNNVINNSHPVKDFGHISANRNRIRKTT